MLEEKYGKAMTPVELAAFLGVDRRTVIREADRWGGVAVSSGRIRFFEKKVMEVLDAELSEQARPHPVGGSSAGKRRDPHQDISGRQLKVREGGNLLGGRKTKGAVGQSQRDPFGLCDSP